MDEEKEYLKSTEAMSFLKISSCDLMHARELDDLEFIKKGNAFLYRKSSLEKYKAKKGTH